MNEHLHSRIGKAISECKKRLFKRLRGGAELEDAAAQFIGELRLALETISRSEDEKLKSATSGTIN